MNSRLLLKQCFNCKHNIECWHLDTPHETSGKYASAVKIKPFTLLKYFLKGSVKNLKYFEYFSLRTCIELINPTIKQDEELIHAYTQQVMAVLEGIACSRDDWWCCPGNDETIEENFIYEPRTE